MSRPKYVIPTHPETIRMTSAISDKVESIQCRSSLWKNKLKSKSDVFTFALEFLFENIDVIEKKMKK